MKKQALSTQLVLATPALAKIRLREGQGKTCELRGPISASSNVKCESKKVQDVTSIVSELKKTSPILWRDQRCCMLGEEVL